MRLLILFSTFLFIAKISLAQNTSEMTKHKVYLIPGQGADYRLYNNLQLEERFEITHIQLLTPPEYMSMKEYAQELSKQINTEEEFSLIGVSIGGMLSVELTDIVKPKQTIIISSAKHRGELPHRYRFMKQLPLNRVIPPILYKSGSKIAQPLVEPDRKNGKEIFVSMLNDKDPLFLKRTVNMIINWERTEYSENIVHIHGTKDHTIPINNVSYDYQIDGGSHMMVLTKGEQISQLINKILLEE